MSDVDIDAMLATELSAMEHVPADDLSEDGSFGYSSTDEEEDARILGFRTTAVVQAEDGTLQLSDQVQEQFTENLKQVMDAVDDFNSFTDNHSTYLEKFVEAASATIVEPNTGRAHSEGNEQAGVVVSKAATMLDVDMLRVKNEVMLEGLDEQQRTQYYERQRIREEMKREEQEMERKKEEERMRRQKERDTQKAQEERMRQEEEALLAKLAADREAKIAELRVAKETMEAQMRSAEEGRKKAEYQYQLESRRSLNHLDAFSYA